jgi:starch synthase
MKIAIDFSDALIVGSENISKELQDYLDKCKKPVLEFQSKDLFIEKYTEFYNKLLN